MKEQLLELEERFWRGDAAFYSQHLADESRMVFPEPVGVMAKEATVASIAGSSRWENVSIEEVTVVPIADAVAGLIYRAKARRDGESALYEARASSVYVRQNGSWQLALHQQTPIEA